MDDQTYAVNFESMRKSVEGGGPSRHIAVVHKDLSRQCQAVIARHRSDTRISISELRRQQQSMQSRLDRLDRDRDRYRREQRRVDRYLTDTARRHEQAQLTAAAVGSRLSGRDKTAAEKREEQRAEAEAMMRFVGRLAMPPETKRRIQDEIIVKYGDMWD